MTLHTAGRKGRLEKAVTVQTDDPANPRLELKLTGMVDAPVELQPAFLALGAVPVGTRRTETVRVVTSEPGIQVVEAVPGNPDQVEASAIQTPEGPALRITFKAGPNPGIASDYVRVRTSHPKMPELNLAIRAEVTGDLAVTPARLTIPAPQAGAPPSAVELKVVSASGKPFKIVKAVDPAGLVQARVIPGKDGVVVRLTATQVPKGMGGSIVLTTNRKDQPTLTTPYFLASSSRPIPGAEAQVPSPVRRPPPPIQHKLPAPPARQP